jgi:hypothetical protein
LAQVSNIDKHRHLNLIPTVIESTERIQYAGGREQIGWTPLRDGAEVKPLFDSRQTDNAVKVERQFTGRVQFDESAISDASQYSIQFVLETFLNAVKDTIVPAFEKFLGNA